MPDTQLPQGQQTRKRALPSIDQIKRLLRYDPETGIVYRRNRWTKNWQPAGTPNNFGYLIITIRENNQSDTVLAHRAAFALMTGRWPSLIDHIDHDRQNNKWTNLREATYRENGNNSLPRGTIAPHHQRTRPKPIIYNITRRQSRSKQGFSWWINVTSNNKRRSTTRQNFCAAWKIRQAWLADRATR